MLHSMADLWGLLLSTNPVLLIELIESALEHWVDILRYINVYVLLLLLLSMYSVKNIAENTYEYDRLWRLMLKPPTCREGGMLCTQGSNWTMIVYDVWCWNLLPVEKVGYYVPRGVKLNYDRLWRLMLKPPTCRESGILCTQGSNWTMIVYDVWCWNFLPVEKVGYYVPRGQTELWSFMAFDAETSYL